MSNTTECHFCGDRFLRDVYDEYTEEVGEILPRLVGPAQLDSDHETVLIHPDCAPRGWETIQMGEDPDWMMA